jgi:multidrug resistance efflux pump
MFRLRLKKFIFEFLLAFFTLLMLGITIVLLLMITILPINNYHHSSGLVEYKKQYNLVSQITGVIEEVYKKNNQEVKAGEPIFRYSSEKNEQEIAALEFHESFLLKEMATLEELSALGVIQKIEIEKKKLEINELQVRKAYLERNNIVAPISGRIYFQILPEYIKGTYIHDGQVLAIIYTNTEKHIKVSFPNEFADRFKIGSEVLVKYKDPRTFRVQKMRGVTYMSFLNQRNNTVELYCEITKGKEFLDLLNLSTVVSTSIVVNNSSIYEEMFGVPPNQLLQNFILKNPVYEKIKYHL